MTIRFRRLLTLGLLLVPALAPAALPPVPDVTTILFSTQNRVNVYPIYARATLRSATGTTSTGAPTTSAAAIVKWLFVYDNTPTPPRTNPRINSVSITYNARVFGPVVAGPTLPPTASDIIPLPHMTLAHAVQLIQKAGVTGAFSIVQLLYVPSPTNSHPNYIFTLAAGGTASIDIITAKVTTSP